jgi:hypothetical protein
MAVLAATLAFVFAGCSSPPPAHQAADVDDDQAPHLAGGVYDGQQQGLDFVELSMAQLGRQTTPATFRYHWDLPSPDWVPPTPPPPIREVSAVLSRVATVWQFHKQFNFAEPGGNFVDANGEWAAVADADYFVFDDNSTFHREVSGYLRGEARKFVADWIAGWEESLVQTDPAHPDYTFHLVKSPASPDDTSYEGVNTELICCTPNLVSLLEAPYETRLGMGQPAIKLNFVNQGGHAQSFTEGDLFVPGSGWEKRLSELCLKKFTDADLMGAVADGTLTSLSPEELSDFIVIPAALRIYLNLGEAGLSSMETGGPDREVDIPWSDLRDYLRPDGPARFLTNLSANIASK